MTTPDNSYADEGITVGSKRRGPKPKGEKKPAPEGIFATKEFGRYLKSHDNEQAEAFLSKTNEEIKRAAIYCLLEIADQTEQVEQNENYIKAKEDLKAFNDALKETIKPLKDTIALATIILRDRGDTLNPDALHGAMQGFRQLAKEEGLEISIEKSR